MGSFFVLFSHTWLFHIAKLFFHLSHTVSFSWHLSIHWFPWSAKSTFKRTANWQCCFVVLPSSTLGYYPWSQMQEQQRCFEREQNVRVQQGSNRLWETMWLWFTSPRRENPLFLCLDPPCYEDNTIRNVILITWMHWHSLTWKNKTSSSEFTS